MDMYQLFALEVNSNFRCLYFGYNKICPVMAQVI